MYGGRWSHWQYLPPRHAPPASNRIAMSARQQIWTSASTSIASSLSAPKTKKHPRTSLYPTVPLETRSCTTSKEWPGTRCPHQVISFFSQSRLFEVTTTTESYLRPLILYSTHSIDPHTCSSTIMTFYDLKSICKTRSKCITSEVAIIDR